MEGCARVCTTCVHVTGFSSVACDVHWSQLTSLSLNNTVFHATEAVSHSWEPRRRHIDFITIRFRVFSRI